MTNLLQYGLSALGVVIVLGILFEVYRYIKGHPQALAALEAKVKAAEGKAATLVDVQSIHSKLDSLLTKMDATHAAALAPVSVTVVPATSTAPEATRTFTIPIAPTTPDLPPWQQPAITYDSAKDGPFADFRAKNGMFRNYVDPQGNILDGTGKSTVVAPDPNGWTPGQEGYNFDTFGTWYINVYPAGQPKVLQITTPKQSMGRIRLVFSGRGGVVGGNMAANLAVTVRDANGNIVAQGSMDQEWNAQPGEKFTATVVSDVDTREGVNINPGTIPVTR